MPGLWAGCMVCLSFARGVGFCYLVCVHVILYVGDWFVFCFWYAQYVGLVYMVGLPVGICWISVFG